LYDPEFQIGLIKSNEFPAVQLRGVFITSKEDYFLELIELTAKIRKTKGKNAAHTLRRASQIPAVLYGPGIDPIPLAIQSKDFEQILKNNTVGQIIFNLKIQNGQTDTRSAMVKELQIHPVSQHFLHADFYEVDMARKITVKVPVVARGKSVGVEMGGTLQLIRHELDVYCLPNEIPEAIELDITDLNIGDAIHVEDISLPGDIEIPAEVNFTVLTISSPKVEAVEEEEAEEEEVGEEEAEADSTDDESA
jgi:large subunit ribosomal protein L25